MASGRRSAHQQLGVQACCPPGPAKMTELPPPALPLPQPRATSHKSNNLVKLQFTPFQCRCPPSGFGTGPDSIPKSAEDPNSLPPIPSDPHIPYPGNMALLLLSHTLVTAASTGELKEKNNSFMRKKITYWFFFLFCLERVCSQGGGVSLWTWEPRCRLGISKSLYLLQFSPCTQNLIHLSLFYMHWHAEWLI